MKERNDENKYFATVWPRESVVGANRTKHAKESISEWQRMNFVRHRPVMTEEWTIASGDGAFVNEGGNAGIQHSSLTKGRVFFIFPV